MVDLRGVRIKINRAKEHFDKLHTAVRAFEARRPFRVEIKRDRYDRSHEHYYFRCDETIPEDWSAIVGDCVHNLRSSLNHLAVALVVANGGVPTNHTSFPIGSGPDHFKISAINRINGASAKAIELVKRLKPYRGGNDTIWRLHRIDIADKHKLLIPVAAAQQKFGIQYHVTDGASRDMPKAPMMHVAERKFPLKDGDVLFSYIRVRSPFIDESEFGFSFNVSFGEGQIFDGEPIIPTLTQLINFTERLIGIFARRVLKIGW